MQMPCANHFFTPFNLAISACLIAFIQSGCAQPLIEVTNHAAGGAHTILISDIVESRQTPDNHADLWIVEGGLNNINYWGETFHIAEYRYEHNWLEILQHARELGVTVIFCEILPVVSEELDPQIGDNAPTVPKILNLNNTLRRMSIEHDFPMIPMYFRLQPYWHQGEDAWCRNEAQIGRLDGVHPNERGVREIASILWEHVYPYVVNDGVTTVALFGDSIFENIALPENKRMDRVLEKISAQAITHARDWLLYE